MKPHMIIISTTPISCESPLRTYTVPNVGLITKFTSLCGLKPRTPKYSPFFGPNQHNSEFFTHLISFQSPKRKRQITTREIQNEARVGVSHRCKNSFTNSNLKVRFLTDFCFLFLLSLSECDSLGRKEVEWTQKAWCGHTDSRTDKIVIFVTVIKPKISHLV